MKGGKIMHQCLNCGQSCMCDGIEGWVDEPDVSCAHVCDLKLEDEGEEE